MVNLPRIEIGKKLQKNFGQKLFLHFGLFFGGFEISKPIFFVIFGFPSKKKFFSHRNVLLSSEINFEVNMISRSQKNEKSSPPPPPERASQGGGCQLILDLVGQIPLLDVNRNSLILFLVVLLVGNKSDLRYDRDVSEEEGKQFAKEKG